MERKLRIKTDGLSTRVFDAETGEDLTPRLNVRSIALQHVAGDVPRLLLECLLVDVDAETGNAKAVAICAKCGLPVTEEDAKTWGCGEAWDRLQALRQQFEADAETKVAPPEEDA